MSANIISLLSGKGGVGKSTLAIHLAQALSLSSKTLLVDADLQGTSRDWKASPNNKSDLAVAGLDRGKLDKDLQPFIEQYDWIIIDGPGFIEKTNAAAIIVSDLVIIPVQPSQVDLWATLPLIDLITTRQTLTGSPAAAFQINRAKKGTQLSGQISRAIADIEGIDVLEGAIHDRIAINRAIGEGSVVGDEINDPLAEIEINRLVKQVVAAFSEV